MKKVIPLQKLNNFRKCLLKISLILVSRDVLIMLTNLKTQVSVYLSGIG